MSKGTITLILASVRPQSSALPSTPHLETCVLPWKSHLGQDQEQLLQWVLEIVTTVAEPTCTAHSRIPAFFCTKCCANCWASVSYDH